MPMTHQLKAFFAKPKRNIKNCLMNLTLVSGQKIKNGTAKPPETLTQYRSRAF
jgi:hypothetical protein